MIEVVFPDECSQRPAGLAATPLDVDWARARRKVAADAKVGHFAKQGLCTLSRIGTTAR
jgi:hypothetical protein